MAVVKVLGGYLEIEGGGVGGGDPPTIWPSPGHPAHPIAPGGYPGAHPEHPIYNPPYPSQGPGFPTPPIYLPPVVPGGPPVTIWPNPPEGQAPIPGHPLPGPQPPLPEAPPEGSKPPPATGGWGYPAEFGKWGYFPAPGEATPKPG